MESQGSDIFEGFLGGIFYGLNLSDFAIPIGILLWLVVMSLRLSNIDFSDPGTGLLFCTFSASVAMILAIVVPEKYHSLNYFQSCFAAFLAFFIISGLRWLNLLIIQKNTIIVSKKGGGQDGKKGT